MVSSKTANSNIQKSIIDKIDADGNETMVGIWDKDANRFYPVP